MGWRQLVIFVVFFYYCCWGGMRRTLGGPLFFLICGTQHAGMNIVQQPILTASSSPIALLHTDTLTDLHNMHTYDHTHGSFLDGIVTFLTHPTFRLPNECECVGCAMEL